MGLGLGLCPKGHDGGREGGMREQRLSSAGAAGRAPSRKQAHWAAQAMKAASALSCQAAGWRAGAQRGERHSAACGGAAAPRGAAAL